MAVYRDKSNGYDGKTWRVAVYYTDWQGNRKKHEKRGFKTKRAAQEYETEFLAKKKHDVNMGFCAFVDLYMDDIKPHIKLTTYATKENIIEKHIKPYFANKSLSGISSVDVLQCLILQTKACREFRLLMFYSGRTLCLRFVTMTAKATHRLISDQCRISSILFSIMRSDIIIFRKARVQQQTLQAIRFICD